MPIENTEEFVRIPADGVTLEGELVVSTSWLEAHSARGVNDRQHKRGPLTSS